MSLLLNNYDENSLEISRLKIAIFNVLFIGFLSVSCGKKNDSKNAPESAPLLRLSTLTEPVFLNNSSELRCEALHQFINAYAGERLEGAKVEQYSCLDMSGLENRFTVKAQITLGGKTSVITQHIAGNAALETEYCGLPFDGAHFETCSLAPAFVEADKTVTGHLSPALGSFRDAIGQYVGQAQTQNLAYGIEAKIFAAQWVSRLDGTYSLPLLATPNQIPLKIKLISGQDSPLAGSATIVEADLPGQAFFGCSDGDCLVAREYNYRFNGHHLVLSTSDGQSLSISLPLLK